MTPRFFLAHAKSCTDEDLDRLVGEASAILDRMAEGKAFNLTLAREYFEDRFKAAGSWDAWINEVATGIEYGSRSPLFKAILVPDGPIGTATAKMIERALAVSKPVVAFKGGLQARRITRVVCLDSRDWKTGYHME